MSRDRDWDQSDRRGRDRDHDWDRDDRRGRRGRDSSETWLVQVFEDRDQNVVEQFAISSKDAYERLIEDVANKQRWSSTKKTSFRLGDDDDAVEVVYDPEGHGIIITTPVGSLNPRY